MAIDPVRDVAVWRWELSGDAFGASPPQQDPDGDGQVFRLDLRFPGQRFDAASGLYHNYFRDYDPTVGRYVQSDPIGLLGGMSTYGYANHAPGSFSDPMGLFGKKIGGGIANMLVRPIVQRLGGGVAARAASAAAHAHAQARRAADMAQRMQTVLGRILKGRSRKGGEPAGCADAAPVRIATEGSSGASVGSSQLLNQIRKAGGTMPVQRGQVSARDIAGASKAGGREIAYYRDRSTGQLFLRELGPQMGDVPGNSRLILHTQPGSTSLSVQPSVLDRSALSSLGQRSSVIVNFDGTYAIRFRSSNVGDGPIHLLGGM